MNIELGAMNMQIPTMFAVATGAYGNIGDAVIRRQVLEWFSEESRAGAHVYVGSAPDEWIRQLRLPDSTRIYRSDSKWRWLRKAALGRGPRFLALDPGEVPLAHRDVPSEIVLLALTACLRIRKSVVIRPPRGVGRTSSAGVWIHRLAVKLSTVSMWRNSDSLALIRFGEKAPDAAFSGEWKAGQSPEERDVLVISYRGARPYPRRAVLDAIRGLAQLHDLKLVCVSQVSSDRDRNAALATELAEMGATHLDWVVGDDIRHETALRALYGRARFVLSDRLHVLILAAMEGAVPIEYVDSPKPKVRVTFSNIGVEGVSVDATATSSNLQAKAHSLLSSRPELLDAIRRANMELSSQATRLRVTVGDNGKSRNV
ncbi:polysaccharide pyruvyl transferase family protein [Demequina sp. SO4-18]|uniref:polysaccharide pyruvyl transferase family protein n=1 Tax=Demequina sp. SO4-18 TaxID=3401026 RepID=UPI003B5C58BB